MMKRFFGKIGGFLLAAVLFVGCVSAPTPPTPEQRINRLAIVLKTTVSSVVTLAAEDRSAETRAKIQKARAAIAILVGESDTTPTSILDAIEPLLLDSKPEIRIAASSAVGLLSAYYGEFVVGIPEGNENARKFLNAVVEGIDQGLKLAPPVNP